MCNLQNTWQLYAQSIKGRTLTWPSVAKKSSAGAPGAPPCFNFLRVYFWKIWQRNTHKLYCNQHATLKICKLFSLNYSHYKSIEYVWWGIKTISRPLNIYRAGTAPPVYKFLDPPLRLVCQLHRIVFPVICKKKKKETKKINK